MKIKIIDLPLVPNKKGSYIRGGTTLEVSKGKHVHSIQIETLNDGTKTFYNPDWDVANKNLNKLIKNLEKCERSYEDYVKVEKSEIRKLTDVEKSKYQTSEADNVLPF